MAARTDEVRRADGSTYRRAGAGPALVLVHGYLGGAAQWQHEFARLSDRFDVIAPDLPGYGDAAAAGCIDRIDGFAAHLAGLVDELGLTRFHLLGHSMGGMIVQEFAARHAARIDRLILYGTGPLGLMPDRFEPLDVSRKGWPRMASPARSAASDRHGSATDVPRRGSSWWPALARRPAKAPRKPGLTP